eukprot:771000-Prymnesium_polylepis.2
MERVLQARAARVGWGGCARRVAAHHVTPVETSRRIDDERRLHAARELPPEPACELRTARVQSVVKPPKGLATQVGPARGRRAQVVARAVAAEAGGRPEASGAVHVMQVAAQRGDRRGRHEARLAVDTAGAQ